MSESVREKAEYVAKYFAGASCSRKDHGSCRARLGAKEVAQAYLELLASNPSDDGEAVDEAFVTSLGFIYLDAFHEYHHNASGLRYHAPIKGSAAYWSFGGEVVFPTTYRPNRGQVRAWFKALGIPLAAGAVK